MNKASYVIPYFFSVIPAQAGIQFLFWNSWNSYGYREPSPVFLDPIGGHGRTASHLTAPAQIPACGTTALGSSEILASVKSKTNKI